jgi:hypothetical protein
VTRYGVDDGRTTVRIFSMERHMGSPPPFEKEGALIMDRRGSGPSEGMGPSVVKTPTIERSRCGRCLHRQVCIYRLERRRPRTKSRRTEVFGTTITIEECEHYAGT